MKKKKPEAIPEWQKKLVLERIKNANPENYIKWEEAKLRLKTKTASH